MAGEEALDRAEAEEQALPAERLAHFLNGGVPVGAERRHHGFMASLDALRATVAAQRFRPGFALFALARSPTAYARSADPKPLSRLTVACARVDRRKNANSHIKR
jgi:hypothetical protein